MIGSSKSLVQAAATWATNKATSSSVIRSSALKVNCMYNTDKTPETNKKAAEKPLIAPKPSAGVIAAFENKNSVSSHGSGASVAGSSFASSARVRFESGSSSASGLTIKPNSITDNPKFKILMSSLNNLLATKPSQSSNKNGALVNHGASPNKAKSEQQPLNNAPRYGLPINTLKDLPPPPLSPPPPPAHISGQQGPPPAPPLPPTLHAKPVQIMPRKIAHNKMANGLAQSKAEDNLLSELKEKLAKIKNK